VYVLLQYLISFFDFNFSMAICLNVAAGEEHRHAARQRRRPYRVKEKEEITKPE
jgi:hypothetical protein